MIIIIRQHHHKQELNEKMVISDLQVKMKKETEQEELIRFLKDENNNIRKCSDEYIGKISVLEYQLREYEIQINQLLKNSENIIDKSKDIESQSSTRQLQIVELSYQIQQLQFELDHNNKQEKVKTDIISMLKENMKELSMTKDAGMYIYIHVCVFVCNICSHDFN